MIANGNKTELAGALSVCLLTQLLTHHNQWILLWGAPLIDITMQLNRLCIHASHWDNGPK